MQTSRAPVDLRDPSVALHHFPHRQDSEMVNTASWKQWMPIQPEGWAQSYCGLEQNLGEKFEKNIEHMRHECSVTAESLLTVLGRGLLEHMECEEYNIDTKKESAGAQEITNRTNTFAPKKCLTRMLGAQWCKGPQLRFSDASYSSLTGTLVETKTSNPPKYIINNLTFKKPKSERP